MDIRIPYVKCKNETDAYSAVKGHLTEDVFTRFGVKGKIETSDSKKVVSAKGTGFACTFTFTSKEVQGEIDLSLLLRPLKGKVVHILEKQLKEII